MEHYDVVIIGSGLNGLLTGALLAKSGKKVCILEKHYVVGGYAHTFNRLCYKFCVGLHYVFNVLPQEDGGTFLRELGLDKEITFTPMDPKKFDRLDFPDRTYDVKKGVERNIKALSKQFPEAEKGLHTYYSTLTEIYNQAFQIPIDLK